MRNRFFLIGLLLLPSAILPLTSAMAQQLPNYSQFRPSHIFTNPGVAGTRRIMDARLLYRKQWMGFDDAPTTQGVALNTRFMRGTMGAGISFFNDKTGPTRRSDLALAYSYHAHFEDVELSMGVAYDRLTYTVMGSELHPHVPYDNILDLVSTRQQKVHNMSAGALFYNDRFHIAVSLLNLFEPTVNYFEESDTLRNNIHLVPHVYGSVGYNWSGQPDWVWENSLQVLYAQANPMAIDYTLRLHYNEKIMTGVSVRLHDAIVFHTGVTILDEFQVSYSYDLVISSLRTTQAGSHEVVLVWSSNIGKQKRSKYDLDRFKRQKYGFVF